MLRVSNSRPTPCKGAALPTELSIRTSPSPRSEKREVTNCTGNFGCVGAWAKKNSVLYDRARKTSPVFKCRIWGDTRFFVAYTLTTLLAVSWIITGHFEWPL